MLWTAKYSEVQTVSPRQAKKMAGTRPIIPLGYDIYLDAFFKLNSERQVSDGHYGSIPVSKIIDYAHWLGINNDNLFVEVLSNVDVQYVNYVTQEFRKQLQQASKG